MDTVLLLSDLLASIERGEPVPPDVAQWLASAIRGLVDGRSLDTGLGLSGPGVRSVRTRVIQRRVDTLLMVALRSVYVARCGASMWDRCKTLAPLLRQYMAGAWSVDRHRPEPPAHGPAWLTWCWYAADLDPDIPLTPEGLYGVVKRSTGFSVRRLPHSLLAQLMSHQP